MLVDLVQIRTADGVRLDGVVQAGAENAPQRPSVDAVLCLHGAGASFYASSVLTALGSRLAQAGWTVARVNTRGHDMVATLHAADGPRRLGSAFEIVDECRLDVRAWADWLVERGHPRVALVGHSLGAIKALYSQAYDPHPAVGAVVALSPPRLSYRWFRETAHGDDLFAHLAIAQEHVDRGRGQTVMDVNFPIPQLISAAGFVDKYGPAERYNVLAFLGRVAAPTLVVFGELELSLAAFCGLPEAIAALTRTAGPIETAVVPAANHQYVGCADNLAATLVAFLNRAR